MSLGHTRSEWVIGCDFPGCGRELRGLKGYAPVTTQKSGHARVVGDRIGTWESRSGEAMLAAGWLLVTIRGGDDDVVVCRVHARDVLDLVLALGD